MAQMELARVFPRDMQEAIKKINAICTSSQEVAESCFYCVVNEIDGKVIVGPSVRFAEIVASCWGNMNIETRVVSNDGRRIMVEARAHDLETNVSATVAIPKNIAGRTGKIATNEAQTLASSASCSVAYRNVLFKIVPASYFKSILENIKEKSLGDIKGLASYRKKAMEYFTKKGVDKSLVFKALSVNKISDVDRAKLFELKGIRNSIEQGDTSIDELFYGKTGKRASTYSQLDLETVIGEVEQESSPLS
jgi:hypothetical protein